MTRPPSHSDPRATLLRPDTGSAAGRSLGLPPELAVSARRRLGTFALFMAGLFLVVAVSIQLLPWDVARDVPGWDGSPAELRIVVGAVQLAAIVLHLSIAWIARSRRFSHRFALTAGLAYEVVLCLLITTGDQSLSFIRDGRYQDLHFAALVIVTYPLFVPGTPRQTLVSTVASAATLPGGLWLLRLAGQAPGFEDYFVAVVMAVACVAIAMAGSMVVHGLQRAVTEARQLGSYRLEQLLGRGGMGEVWRARHRLLARPAAVKVVRPEMLGARTPEAVGEVLQRFEREAQTTALLRSPHTIEVYDFGVADDGTFYYVMELLDGLDLGSLVERHGPVPAARATALWLQMCDSLAEAHGYGLIHRDIKPANVFVCRYGRHADVVKVLDFGLVTSRELPADASLVTEAGVVHGTPAFMAPEQVRGLAVDGRADIYAMGCVAYWLMTGQRVFDGPSPVDVMLQHAGATPVPPSQRTELPVPPVLDGIVMACLAKNPEDRPQTADALAARLTATSLAGGWTPDDALQWWDLHRPAATGPPGLRAAGDSWPGSPTANRPRRSP